MKTDMLTGLAGRDGMRETLGRHMSGAEGVALATLDLDNFLSVNQEFGHDTGDHVLRTVADLLQSDTQNSGGTAFRLSGDEFAAVLPGLTLEQAFLQMEVFRKTVETAVERFALPDTRRVTVTVGVAQFPRDARDVPGLTRAAEAALASAKEGGRNAVALPPNEDMVMKSCYYPAAAVRKLKTLSDKLGRKESVLLREALTDLIAKYDVPTPAG